MKEEHIASNQKNNSISSFSVLSLKAKSIDVLADPKDVYEKVKKELEKEVKIHWQSRLDPFEKDHCLFVVERK